MFCLSLSDLLFPELFRVLSKHNFSPFLDPLWTVQNAWASSLWSLTGLHPVWANHRLVASWLQAALCSPSHFPVCAGAAVLGVGVCVQSSPGPAALGSALCLGKFWLLARGHEPPREAVSVSHCCHVPPVTRAA